MPKFRKASADEVRAKRKEHVKEAAGGLVMVKGFKAPPSWNKEARSARFIMSSESVDRYRDIVVQSGLSTDRFMENPQGLLFHNSRSWPCGLWSDVAKILNGRPKRTEGTLTFLPEGTDEDADRAARHVAAGSLRTVSIGFAPNWDEIDFILDDDDDWTGGFRYNESELLECSLVPIPAQPDALVKDAGGDLVLARDLIEEVLDTWAKTPEGLLVPMDEYREKHFDLAGNRTSIIVDKALQPVERKFAPAAGQKLEASSDEEAASFTGAKVTFKADHPENKDYPFDVIGRASGEVIASYIVHGGENDGVHALAVEFLTDGWTGLFRGIKAERFLLVEMPKAEEPETKDVPAITDEVIDAFVALMKDGDVVSLSADDDLKIVVRRSDTEAQELVFPRDVPAHRIAEVAGTITSRFEAKQAAAKKTVNTVEVGVEVDSTALDETTAKLTALESLIEKVSGKLARIFVRSTPAPEPEEPPPAPSEEEIAAAKAKAAATRERLRAAGRIAA